MGSLGLTFGGFAEQEEKVNRYRRRIADCEPAGAFVNERVATVNFLYCHPDNETGVRTGSRLTGSFGYLAAQLLPVREVHPTRSYPNPGLLAASRQQAEQTPGAGASAPEGVCIGNPDRLIEEIKKWEACGVDQSNFLLNALETIPQQEVLDSLRLFGEEVMPTSPTTSPPPPPSRSPPPPPPAAASPLASATAHANNEGPQMPINGNADPTQLTQYAPAMASLDTEPLTLPDVKVLQVIYEIDDAAMADLLPPALHPTIPPTVHVIRPPRRRRAARRIHPRRRPRRLPRHRPPPRPPHPRRLQPRPRRRRAQRPLGLPHHHRRPRPPPALRPSVHRSQRRQCHRPLRHS